MVRKAENIPVTTEEKAPAPSALPSWRSMGDLRREIDLLFDDFVHGFWRYPFRRPRFDVERSGPAWMGRPAVDVAEKADAYEISVELPGLDDKSIEVKLVTGGLLIRGEKQEETDEKEKDYYLHERRFGSFERRFTLPEDVDTDRIEANMKNGLLTVTVPKKADAQRPEKKIEVKQAA